MSKIKLNILEQLHMKGVNKRITILLVEEEASKSKAFIVNTRTLVGSWKTRNIQATSNYYSPETLVALKEAFGYFLDNPKLKNKVLLKDLSRIKPYKTRGTL